MFTTLIYIQDALSWSLTFNDPEKHHLLCLFLKHVFQVSEYICNKSSSTDHYFYRWPVLYDQSTNNIKYVKENRLSFPGKIVHVYTLYIFRLVY